MARWSRPGGDDRARRSAGGHGRADRNTASAGAGWATIRGIDARSVYLDRPKRDPSDALALVALAEIRDHADHSVLRRALADARPHVRAAAVKAVARFDMPAAKSAAMDEIVSGRSVG